jgi:predicted acyl esterase
MAQATEHVERMNVPMFFITGWYDHATARELESFRTLVASGGPKAREGGKLLVGPWTHTAIDQAKQGDLSFDGAAGEARARRGSSSTSIFAGRRRTAGPMGESAARAPPPGASTRRLARRRRLAGISARV